MCLCFVLFLLLFSGWPCLSGALSYYKSQPPQGRNIWEMKHWRWFASAQEVPLTSTNKLPPHFIPRNLWSSQWVLLRFPQKVNTAQAVQFYLCSPIVWEELLKFHWSVFCGFTDNQAALPSVLPGFCYGSHREIVSTFLMFYFWFSPRTSSLLHSLCGSHQVESSVFSNVLLTLWLSSSAHSKHSHHVLLWFPQRRSMWPCSPTPARGRMRSGSKKEQPWRSCRRTWRAGGISGEEAETGHSN